MTTRLLLVRHGQTDWNLMQRWCCNIDVPLNDTGRRQAEALARRLSRTAIDAAYASSLQRAQETARIIVAHRTTPLALRIEHDLRELEVGLWDGLTIEEVQERYPDDHARLWDPSKGYVEDFTSVGGESIIALQERVARAMDSIVARHPDQTVLVVAHGGSLLMYLRHLLDLPLDNVWRFHLSNCSLSIAEIHNPHPVLVCLNDTAHLEGIDVGS